MATASTIIKTASNEIGVKETGNNNVKYNTEYYGKAVNGDAYPWCAVFVWWVFKHSGASSIFYGGGKTASVYEIWRYYNSLGRVYSSPKSETSQLLLRLRGELMVMLVLLSQSAEIRM